MNLEILESLKKETHKISILRMVIMMSSVETRSTLGIQAHSTHQPTSKNGDYLQRLAFWSGSEQGDLELVERDRVCALEVWCEALGGDKKNMRHSDTSEINSIIERFPDWERFKTVKKFGYCGAQRGFQRLK